MSPEQILREKYKLELPEAPVPASPFSTTILETGNLVYLAGQTPKKNGTRILVGAVGRELTVEQGQEAARWAIMNSLAVLKAYLGSFDRVKQFIQIIGYVHSAPGFGEQSAVVNGASELLFDLFGDRGRHTRAALGVSDLAGGCSIEITCVVEILKSPVVPLAQGIEPRKVSFDDV